MRFKTIGEFYLWIKRHEMCILDGGSQGICYKIGNKVFKIFLQFLDEIDEYMIEYDKDSILQFASIVNSTYIFPSDVIMIGDMVIGYVTDYVNAKSLYKINPLSVHLDEFEERLKDVYPDIEIISKNGVQSYDVIYNIMYGIAGFKIIDPMEYTRSFECSSELFRINKKNFNIGIKLFLTDGYFDDFLLYNKLLNSMFCDPDVDMNIFLKEFRTRLSEIEGYKINMLGQAKKSLCLRKKEKTKFIRDICM